MNRQTELNEQSDVINILLIEDNPGDARLICEMLHEESSATFELIWAETLQASLGMLKEKEIDVVLSDLSLPDSNGLNTLHSILAHTKRAHTPPISLPGKALILGENLRRISRLGGR